MAARNVGDGRLLELRWTAGILEYRYRPLRIDPWRELRIDAWSDWSPVPTEAAPDGTDRPEPTLDEIGARR